MGTDGSDLYSRLSKRFGADLMLGLELHRMAIGNTVSGFSGPTERRIGGGIDVSYRVWEKVSLFAAYELMRVTNRNFRSADDGFDHLLRLELTRPFR